MDRRFDLNYVGCEQGTRLVEQARALAFDLNYVGCEPRLQSTV